MISNYNLSCDYHNFELKDKIYLIPQWALKVIYTDGFNEAVFSGNSANVTILEGYDISFQEETSFDERFKFSKTLSIKVEGYVTFNDLDNRYMAIIETKEGEFYLVNVDFPSYVTHTYTLNNGTNSTELVFSSQSNIATLKLTNFEPNNVNSCKQYSNAKIKNVKLTEAWASYLSTWQKSLVNKGEFVDIEPLQDSISLTEEFDGEKYTVTLGFDIPMSYYKNDWHLKLLQFEENKYRGYIELEDGNVAFAGYNVGLFPSYTINGDIISIKLQEIAIRGIAYGNDYVLIDTDIPNTIEYNGASCYTYNWNSTCDWHVEDKPDYITISPTSGEANTQYELEICNTDDETGYEVSEFIIKSCHANARANVIISNPIYRWINTQETVCSEITNERWVESGTTCTGTHGVDKWVNSVKQISYDSGATWVLKTPVEQSATTLIQVNSPDCGYAERWIESGFTCNGFDKYQNNVKQISYDSGATWSVKVPVEESASTLIEYNSADCGYSPQLYEYLTFIPTSNTTFRFSGNTASNQQYVYMNTLDYSLDSGQTWTEIGDDIHLHGYETRTVNAGEKIMWRVNSKYSQTTGLGTFRCTTPFTIEGNIMSLLNSNPETFSGMTSLKYPSFANNNLYFDSLFKNCNVTNAENLLLPATTLTTGCYNSMFQNCTSLTKAPKLPAINLVQACYSNMFRGCVSLQESPILSATTLAPGCYSHMFYSWQDEPMSLSAVTCLATDISATGCVEEWLNSVPLTGTFYKNSSMSSWPTGGSGIPSGWTVQNYSS